MGKVAFVFSGQGAQYTGMGKSLCEASKAAESVFDMADSIRTGTSNQCFTADSDELCRTVNTQPCVFTADLAAARAVEEKGITPDFVAGFSLGEIVALAFSGILTDEEAFKLVCRRGEFMDEAANENKGAMAAVMKLSADKIEEICSDFEDVWPVNYNSPAQTVVAARAEKIDSFCEAVKANKGRAVPLSVSGAFHSPLMHTAAVKLSQYLKGVEVCEWKIPMYSNFTAEIYSTDYKNLIASQVENPVRWQKIIENMASNGVDTFVEVGVGKTLTGLIKKILPEAKAFKVENAEDLEALCI